MSTDTSKNEKKTRNTHGSSKKKKRKEWQIDRNRSNQNLKQKDELYDWKSRDLTKNEKTKKDY